MHREDDCPCHTCTCRCHETGTGPDSTVKPLYTRSQLAQLDELNAAAWKRAMDALDTARQTRFDPDDWHRYEVASAYQRALDHVCLVVNTGVFPKWFRDARDASEASDAG